MFAPLIIPACPEDNHFAHPRRAIYFTAPRHIYATPHYGRARLWLDTHAPLFMRVISACGGHEDDHDWPGVVSHSAALVFIVDDGGYVDRAVADELALARELGRPVLLLADDGRFVPYDDLALSLPDGRDGRRYRRVTLVASGLVSP